MTIPLICVFVAYLLIWFPRILVVVATIKSGQKVDNNNPRDQQARLEGWGKRAQAAHNNAFESFAPFAASVFTAHLAGADPTWMTRLAITHVVARTIYPFLYIADQATLRSSVWGVGMLATVGLFLLGLLR